MPLIESDLFREEIPETIRILLLARRKNFAKKLTSARLALPFAGGAVMPIL